MGRGHCDGRPLPGGRRPGQAFGAARWQRRPDPDLAPIAPYLALRSYLPADHPDKSKEIGSEPDPATFIDVMLALTAEWRRILAPHGSIVIELGDTYSGSGGHILDPFGGSGTTGEVATGCGRDCTLIDIDETNVDLARQRIGMFLEVVE